MFNSNKENYTSWYSTVSFVYFEHHWNAVHHQSCLEMLQWTPASSSLRRCWSSSSCEDSCKNWDLWIMPCQWCLLFYTPWIPLVNIHKTSQNCGLKFKITMFNSKLWVYLIYNPRKGWFYSPIQSYQPCLPQTSLWIVLFPTCCSTRPASHGHFTHGAPIKCSKTISI